MSWNSGPCEGGPDQEPAPDEERNVVPPGDDEEIDSSPVNEDEPDSHHGVEHGGTHFAVRVQPNQRKHPDRSRGPVRDAE